MVLSQTGRLCGAGRSLDASRLVGITHSAAFYAFICNALVTAAMRYRLPFECDSTNVDLQQRPTTVLFVRYFKKRALLHRTSRTRGISSLVYDLINNYYYSVTDNVI